MSQQKKAQQSATKAAAKNFNAASNAAKNFNNNAKTAANAFKNAANTVKINFPGVDNKAFAEQQKQFSSFFSGNSKAWEEAISTGADEVRKAQEKFIEAGRENAENFSKSAERAAEAITDSVALSKDNIEAVIESANIASQVSKSIAEEISGYANQAIAENFKVYEQLLSCKTASDFFNLHSNIAKSAVDSVFKEGLKISELFLEYSTAVEPLTERATATAEKITKNFSNK